MDLLLPHNVAQFALAQLEDDDALHAAVATAVTTKTYTGATLDGVLANPGPAVMRLPQRVRVETSASAVTYNTTAPIVFTGTDEDGDALTESITLANAGGNEVQDGTSGFKTLTSIYVPAQLLVTGQFLFGVTDIVLSGARPGVKLRFGAAGNIVVKTGSGQTEALTGGVAESQVLLFGEVIDANTTADPLTVYVGLRH